MDTTSETTFELAHRLESHGGRGRTGVLSTPHGRIHTPAFIPVGTAASVKTLTPEQVAEVGSQAVLANAYHLHLQPGSETVDEAGGVGAFMRWPGPTYTDSGGFQVMSLGAGYKKVIDMTGSGADTVLGERLAKVDDDGVTFRSHRDGSTHRFTAEVSMGIQHRLGADIMFAFDELTTLHYPRERQELAVQRTHAWAERALREHDRLTAERVGRARQSLWGVVQGAQYEDLRRDAVRGLLALSEEAVAAGRRGFGGFGIGGALEKQALGTIVGWCVDEMPEHMPRHLLGISEPDDVFAAVENGADTFDCVAPTRAARHGTLLTRSGRVSVRKAALRRDHSPLDPGSTAAAGREYTRAYVNHLVRANEQLASTILTMVNVAFMNALMADVRDAIESGRYAELKADFLGSYYGTSRGARAGGEAGDGGRAGA